MSFQSCASMMCLRGWQKWICRVQIHLRTDPLPDWLQPFDGNLVDEEEQRVGRVEVHEEIQDGDQERKRIITRRERARPQPQTQASRSAGGSGTRTDAELMHIPYRNWCVHCVRRAKRSDAHRRRGRQVKKESLIRRSITSFINISDLSLVRCFVPRSEDCFRGDLLHRQLVVAVRLLEAQVLNFNVLCLAQPSAAYDGQSCTGVNAQPNRDDSTQVFGKRLNSHRLCCCTVASVQFYFCGAGDDNALLFRPSLGQVLPVQDHAPTDRFSRLSVSYPIRVSKGVQGTWMSLPFKQTPNPWPSNEKPLHSLYVLQVLCVRPRHL